MSRRDYRKEYLRDHASDEAKRRRAARNLWNRRLKGKVPAGKEIDHKNPLRSGGSNGMSNIRYRSISANRADNGHQKTAMFYRVLEEKRAAIEYRGKTFPGYNKPIENRDGGQHKKIVLAKQGDEVKMIRFGHRGYGHNISPERKKNYLTRSAGIRDKSGRLTKDNKLSANYWSRRVLWPSQQKADGSARRSK